MNTILSSRAETYVNHSDPANDCPEMHVGKHTVLRGLALL
jgi:hypothetical protein